MRLKNLRKLVSALIIAGMLCSNALAFTPFMPSDKPESSTESSESSETTDSAESSEPESTGGAAEGEEKPTAGATSGNVPGITMNPKEYFYYAFQQILDLYVKNHLYDFTEEEVMDKLMENLLTENPQYFKFLVSYMLSTMDPYSSYHEASSNFLNVDKASSGFGITVEETDDGTVVKSVLADSNALTAGVMPGDKFVSVAGYNVEHLPSSAVMLILRRPYAFILDKNEKGDYSEYNPPCEIIVDRNGEKLTFNLTRGAMTAPQITHEISEDGTTAYISIATFLGVDMDKEFNELIYSLEEQGIKNLTIDLRDNGGGSLDYALSMVETFIPKDELMCYYNDKSLEEPTPIYSTTPKASFDSISVLVNGNTASAAELFTSILQTKELATVVGSLSYGKSIGQTVYYLMNGDYITITSYEILDVNKGSYNGIGVKPDIAIENVELYYELPALGAFNHENYVDIAEGVYNDVTKALEDRLVVMGLMYEKDADGIFDATTAAAVRVYQRNQGIEATGYVTPDTVSQITNTINGFKTYTYDEDSQYDVATMVHRSVSQGKRLAAEKQELAKKNAELIKARDDRIIAELDAEELAAKAQ